jgi:hypothetical protein
MERVVAFLVLHASPARDGQWIHYLEPIVGTCTGLSILGVGTTPAQTARIAHPASVARIRACWTNDSTARPAVNALVSV